MFFESDFWFGNSQALLVEMVKFGQSIVNLMQDSHPRVRWAKIPTIGQLSTYLSPRFQEEYLWQLLPALIEVLDDFDYPRLQRGLTMVKEAALETLASVAISSQEDSAYMYDSIIPYLKVILETVTKDTSRTPLAKSMECITMVTMAFGNQAIHGYVEKVTAVLISLQETQTEMEDPMRKFSLLLSVSNSSDTDDSDDERLDLPITTSSLPSKVGVRFVHTLPPSDPTSGITPAELKGRLHLWVNEVASALVPVDSAKNYAVTVKFSFFCAMKKGVPVTGVKGTCSSKTIGGIQRKHSGSRLSKHQAEKFVEGISKIGICLGTMVKKLKSNDRTAEERRIVVHLFCDVAEQCREEAFRYYEDWIPLLLKVYYHKDPDIPQIVAIVIGICGEFGSDFLKPHSEGIFGCLKTALEHSFLRKVTGVPTRFKLKELKEGTDNFGLLVGRGSSACVFKGVLSDGASVAVKRIDGEERGDKEFKSEVAAIASVQHVNLVRLYCSVPPSGPRFLVYEYIVNGSLDNWIFRKRGIRGCLSLDLRCRVGLDVGKALSYLHHDCRSCILHLDVKPENILLDKNHRAILVDFGLSKLMGKVESRVVTTIRGTRGYLAPEWLLENGILRKVMFIATEWGRSWKYEAATVGVAVEMQVKRLACVALSCIQERPSLRSTMARVVEMLEGRGPVEAPRQTTMLILDLLDEGVDHHPGIPRVAAAMARSDTYSLRSYTMSILSGR
ncbi:hypothetical protein KY285_025883 [Solanum tuberosum]|nr:hypothetical protein KY285_025883 [Solanum tuberosum]